MHFRDQLPSLALVWLLQFVAPLLAFRTLHTSNYVRPLRAVSVSVDALLPTLKQDTLSSLLSRDAAIQVLAELRSDPSFFERNEELLNALLLSLEQRVREEGRSIRELLGPTVTGRIISLVDETNVYDSQSVRAFLQTGIVEQMLGEILYEAIFEFLQRADIVGEKSSETR